MPVAFSKFNEQNELKCSFNKVQRMFLFTKDFDPENKLHSSQLKPNVMVQHCVCGFVVEMSWTLDGLSLEMVELCDL